MSGSLTRVCSWQDGHGWQPVSAESFAKKQTYKHSISSDKRIFLCELCDQYASFVNAGIYKPHFKHPRGSKDCDEKITSSDNYLKTNPLGFSLPIRIKTEGRRLEIFIGFLPIGEGKLCQIEDERGQIIIYAGNKSIATFNIDSSRLMSDKISYLSVGSNIAEKYRIDCGNKVEKNYWPVDVDGFHRNGTLFDKASGKRLPRNANDEVGREYWLIRKISYWYQPSPEDIDMKKEMVLGDYEIYVVKAKLLSRSAADFFMSFGARLADAVAEIIPIYPFVLNSPHFILHNFENIWFHKTGGYIDTYPDSRTKMPTANVFSARGDGESILLLSRFEGRTSVLRYAMLRKNSVDFEKAVGRLQSSLVEVCDEDGVDFESGQHNYLPKNRELSITSEFDGHANVYNSSGDFVIEQYQLKNGSKIRLSVAYGYTYKIFQGLDCVFETAFVCKDKQSTISDEQHLTYLRRCKGHKVAVTHTFGAVVAKLSDMPLTRLWVMTQLRRGVICTDAKEYLKKL